MEINSPLSSLPPALGELPSEHAATRDSFRSPSDVHMDGDGRLFNGKSGGGQFRESQGFGDKIHV